MLRFSAVRMSGALMRKTSLVTSPSTGSILANAARFRVTGPSSCQLYLKKPNNVQLLSSKASPEDETKELVLTPGQKVVAAGPVSQYLPHFVLITLGWSFCRAR